MNKMVTYFTENVLTQWFHEKYTHWIWFGKSIFILQIPVQSKHMAETYNWIITIQYCSHYYHYRPIANKSFILLPCVLGKEEWARVSASSRAPLAACRPPRVLGKEEWARVSASSRAPLAACSRADRLPPRRSSLSLHERHSTTLPRQWATTGRRHRVM